MKLTNTGNSAKGLVQPLHAQRFSGSPASSAVGSAPMIHMPIPLVVNVQRPISLAVDSQQMFKVNWGGSTYSDWLEVCTCGPALEGKVDIFLKLGVPPTLDSWDLKGSPDYYGARVIVAEQTGGTWYILVQGHANCVTSLYACHQFVH